MCLHGTVKQLPMAKAKLEHLLDDLETREAAHGITMYLRAGQIQDSLDALQAGDYAGIKNLPKIAPKLARSETGAVVFWTRSSAPVGTTPNGTGFVVLPPFPVERDELLEGWNATQLRAILGGKYVLGVILLRLGRYAVGVWEGETLVASKTGTRYVGNKHSAGGQSQKRFERFREKQIQEIFQKTCLVVTERFAPYEDRIDHIILGGEKFTLGGFLKRCDYLKTLSPKILGRVLDVRKPGRMGLEEAIGKVWESQVFSFDWGK